MKEPCPEARFVVCLGRESVIMAYSLWAGPADLWVEPVDLWDKASGFVGWNLWICRAEPPETAKPPVLSGGFFHQHRHAYGYEGDGQDARRVVLPAFVGLGSGEVHHRVAFNDADAVSDVVHIQLQA